VYAKAKQQLIMQMISINKLQGCLNNQMNNEAFIFEEREKREMEKFFVYLTFFHFCLCSPAPSTHGIF